MTQKYYFRSINLIKLKKKLTLQIKKNDIFVDLFIFNSLYSVEMLNGNGK